MTFMIPRLSNYTHNGQVLHLKEGSDQILGYVQVDVLYAEIVEESIDLSKGK